MKKFRERENLWKKKSKEGESERGHPLKMFQILVLVLKTLCIYNMVNMKNKEN